MADSTLVIRGAALMWRAPSSTSRQRAAGSEKRADSAQHAGEACCDTVKDCAYGNRSTSGAVFAMRDLGVRKRERTLEHRGFSAAGHSMRTGCIMFASPRLFKRRRMISAKTCEKGSTHAACCVRRSKVDPDQRCRLIIGVGSCAMI
jgi:hypothetical protein